MWLLLLVLVTSVVTGAVQPASFTGTVIDADCARAGHAAMRMGETDAECAKACVISHDSAFLLEVGPDLYRLSDQKSAERFAAQKVTIVGTLDESTRTIKVDSITPAR